MDIIKS